MSESATGPGAGVEIRLADGDRVVVDGELDEVEKLLSDASRSGASRLAWFRRSSDGGRIGINPAHVATLTSRAGQGA